MSSRADSHAGQCQRLSVDGGLCQRNRRRGGRISCRTLPRSSSAKVVYQYLYRQIDDKGVRETIDFLLNREEAHNTMFREAFNKIQDSGSQKDWGTTADSRLF